MDNIEIVVLVVRTRPYIPGRPWRSITRTYPIETFRDGPFQPSAWNALERPAASDSEDTLDRVLNVGIISIDAGLWTLLTRGDCHLEVRGTDYVALWSSTGEEVWRKRKGPRAGTWTGRKQ